MNKKKKQSLTLSQSISIGLSTLFLITLFGAVKWANYRQTFYLSKINIYGYEILKKTDYDLIIKGLTLEDGKVFVDELSSPNISLEDT